MPDGPWPGTGAVLAAIETAAGRTADRVAGKPEPPMYEAARDRLGEGRCLAVGDRLEIDVARRAPRRDGLRARAHGRRHAARRPRPPTRVPPTSRTRSRRWCFSRRPPMDRDLCLIVNPTAGAGRAAKLLGAVEAELRGMGLRFRVERTTSMEHARELRAAARPPPGEIVAAMGGDGLTGAVAGELRDGAGVLAVLPGGRGNDFARKLGIPADPVAACALLRGAERRIDLAAVDGRTLPRHPQRRAWTPTPTGSRTRTGCRSAPRVYAYAALRALAELEARALDRHRRRRAARASTGTPSPWPTRASSAAACTSCPDARLDDGLLDVVLVEDVPKRRYLANAARRCSRAPTSTSPACTSCAAAA